VSGQKQHVDLYKKLLLRKRLCSKAASGAAYVPFIGDGDIAVECYADRLIYGADLDPERVTTAQGRFVRADIRVADCNGWPFPDIDAEFAIADLDAYCNPYLAFDAFWTNARKTDRLIVFGTDGMKQRIARGKCLKSLPDGTETPASMTEHRHAYNFWWARYAKPWIAGRIGGAVITSEVKYLRGMMLYWGIVIDYANRT
jgi:hypothetical protein